MSTHHARWCDRHRIFTRFYVPALVTATFLMHVWEVTHR